MSKSDLASDPIKRMATYLENGRKLAKAAFDIDFDSNVWQLPLKREAGRFDHLLDFKFLEEPFRNLIKAVVSNETAQKNGRGSWGERNSIRAVGHLGIVSSGIADLSNLSTDHFHRAFGSLRDRTDLAGTTKANLGGCLVRLAGILNRSRLTKCRIEVKNPFLRSEPLRSKHMIPEGAIQAFGAIWQEIMSGTNNDRDRLLACTVTMLLCTGFRINELLSMPRDCWHPSHGKDRQGRLLKGVYLGYAPEKNGLTDATFPKWIPSDLISLVKECLDEILRITEPFLENARALHAGRVNLPDLEENRTYTGIEAAELLGYSKGFTLTLRKKGGFQKIVSHGSRRPYALTAQEICELVRSRSFLGQVISDPWPQKLHESLFVVSNSFFKNRNGMNGSADLLRRQTIYSFLSGRGDSEVTGRRSCFERFNQFDPATGKPWKFATHDPRHTLTTWMKRAGISELEIAAWFGRNGRDPIAANEDYDHREPWELLEIVRNALERGNFRGPYADILASVKDPIRREELKQTMIGNISYSRLGLCAHAEGTAPPPIPEACARCPGLIVVKGNPGHIKNTQEQLVESKRQIARYQRQINERYFGKEKWLEIELERRDGLLEMLKIHMNVEIPHGTLVQISPARKSQQKKCL